MNNARTKEPRMITDAQRRAFFFYLKAAGYKMPDEKEQAYADLGITSTKNMTAVEMETTLRKLRRGTGKGIQNQGVASEEKKRERYEQWRAEFFPANVIAFGSDSKKRVISKRQQDFIITNALRVFRDAYKFRKWMLNMHGVEIISDEPTASAICRGLAAMAQRGGYDPAPPMASSNRRDWEKRHCEAKE